MSHRRHGLRTFGVCLFAALGLTALIASAAHAENLDWSKPEFTWTIEKKEIAATEYIKVKTITAPELNIPELGFTISCSVFTADGALIKTGGESSATLLFSSCSVLNAAKCIVKEPIEAKVKDELRSHNGEDYDVFLPATGTVFTIIVIGGKCAANNEAEGGAEITGAVAVLVGTEALAQTISETGGRATQESLFNLGLFYGGQVAELLGSASATLAAFNEGKKWGADGL